MSTKEEDRIRKIEDTLLLIPQEFDKITSTQAEIVEHLEQINGSFGDFDDRLRSIETIQDYDDMRKGEKKEGKRQFLNITNVVITGIVATQGLVVILLALS